MPSLSYIILFLALAVLTFADSITFKNLDGQAREICWYSPSHADAVHTGVIPPHGSITIDTGNFMKGQGYMFHPVNAGDGMNCNRPTVVGEISFHGWQDYSYYDISAVDDLSGNTGIHRLYPTWGGPTCECDWFPCNNECVFLCRGANCDSTRSSPSTDFVVEMWVA